MKHGKRIYVDTEYIYEDMWHERRMPLNTDKKEIIQIAAVLFDHNLGKEIEHFDILITPHSQQKLPPFFIKLTNITQKMLNIQGMSFPTAFKKFISFCKEYPIWTFNNDYHVFEQNCEYYDIKLPCTPFIKVKEKLPQWGVDPQKYSSGTLYKATKLNLTGHVHDALHDVRSMSQAVHILEQNQSANKFSDNE